MNGRCAASRRRRRAGDEESILRLPKERRAFILDAGIEVFAAKGFDRAAITDLCSAARISNGALYKYFDRKNDLFLTAVEQGSELIEAVYADIPLALPPKAYVRAVFARIADFPQTHRSAVSLYIESVILADLNDAKASTIADDYDAYLGVKEVDAKKLVDFPEPIGRNPVYYTGHAESVSMPRSMSGLTEATLRGGVKPAFIVSLVKTMSHLGLLGKHEQRMRLARFFHNIEGWFAAKGIDKSIGRIDAYSAAKWLAEGRLDERPAGVYSADSLFDEPSPFIDELKKMGIAIGEDSMAREERKVGLSQP